MRCRPAVAAVAVVVMVAAGCHHRRHAAVSPPPSPSTTADTAAVVPAPEAATTSTVIQRSTSPPSTTAAVARCAISSLVVTLTSKGAAAGTEYLELDFKNTALRACTLQGYPGVSFVDAGGSQIGAAVPRMAGASGAVVAAPGAAVAALIAYHDVVVGIDNCQPTMAAGIRVYPPDETASVIVATKLAVCADPGFNATASVSPVAAPADLRPR
jgi:hypothetical protein